ncbi:MAG: DUF5666 domain-containing protein [Hydrogenophaga sp.]
MQKILPSLFLTCGMLLSGAAWADNDIEGTIESISAGNQSVVVQGILIFTTPSTDYDDGLRGFQDLKVGQRVEIDYVMRDGQRYAQEVELDD